MSNSWFPGSWFPAGWFGPWFPGWTPPALFQGYGPGGAATFAADLESGFKVTLDWSTDVEKAYSGKEKRTAVRDAPKQHYEGATVLLGDDPARVRSTLAALMGAGLPFLLGLQYEALTQVAPHSGNLVFVNPAMIPWTDWLVEGQRVLCKNADDEPKFVSRVLQKIDEDSGALLLDGDPGFAGGEFCEIMPAFAIYFESQQTFDRYPTNVEQWNMSARNAIFDFAPPHAKLDLEAVTGDPSLHGAFLMSRVGGYAEFLVEFNGHGGGTPDGGSLTEAGPADTLFFKSGITTLGDVATLLINNSGNFLLVGDYDPSVVLVNPTHDFTTSFSNLITVGKVGSGATLTEYDGKFVWDWPIVVDTSGQDSIQSMIEIFDFGGVPVAVSTADVPDFGRHLMIRSSRRQDWQWLKKFLWSVRGCQKAFWLPTWRVDLKWESGSGTDIVVSGDIRTLYPRQRDRVMVLETGGVPVYTKILGAVDNGDGTTTITLEDAVDNIEMISWLELCRFEEPQFEILWTRSVFELQATARAVQQ